MSDAQDHVNRDMSECATALTSSGMTLEDAQEAVEGMAQVAYERARNRTAAVYTEGQGTQLLQREAVDASLHAAFEKRRAEGVTDDDIRWWWNMSAFEQEMLLAQDEINRMALHSYLLGKGMKSADAVKEVFKRNAKWGDPTEETGDDRPLPCELKRRIVSYVEQFYDNPAELKRKLAGESSFNALVRKEIANRNL